MISLNSKRLREKIRSYIGTSEYKERDNSLETTKAKIEDYMETYKGWEKEAKMKAFSNEGLASAKLDKKAEDRMKALTWLSEGLKTLNGIQSSSEAELESLGNRPKKSKRGKHEQKLDAQKAKIDYIKQQIKRVESLISGVEREAIDMDLLNDLKDIFLNYLKEPSNTQAKTSWDTVISRAIILIEI